MPAPTLRLLDGVRVVAFSQFLLGPAACQYLADMGADVVKVEHPGSGAWERSWAGADTYINGVSAFFLLANRNQRSVALDLKSPAGLAAARRLVEAADVVVENFRPGVMDRLGLGYDDVRTINPGVIYASGSGYGSTGPYRHLPGQDLLIQALSGFAANTGSADQGPTVAGAAVVDQHSASLLAMGILGALVHRERTGDGERVEVTLMQGALDLQTEPVVYHLNGAHLERPRSPLADTFHAAPYGLYETSDGHLAISMTPIATLSTVLGDPEALQSYLDPAVAYTHRDQIRRILDPLIRERTTAEWVTLLRESAIWCAPVNDLAATFDDEAVRYLDPVIEFEHPDAGTVRVLQHPVRYRSGTAGLTRQPPALGEHTREVLEEVGCTPAEIAAVGAGQSE